MSASTDQEIARKFWRSWLTLWNYLAPGISGTTPLFCIRDEDLGLNFSSGPSHIVAVCGRFVATHFKQCAHRLLLVCAAPGPHAAFVSITQPVYNLVQTL